MRMSSQRQMIVFKKDHTFQLHNNKEKGYFSDSVDRLPEFH